MRVVGDVLDQLGALGGRQRDLLVDERLVDVLVHEAAQLVLADGLVGEHRADLLDDELVHPLAQVLELRWYA